MELVIYTGGKLFFVDAIASSDDGKPDLGAPTILAIHAHELIEIRRMTQAGLVTEYGLVPVPGCNPDTPVAFQPCVCYEPNEETKKKWRTAIKAVASGLHVAVGAVQ